MIHTHTHTHTHTSFCIIWDLKDGKPWGFHGSSAGKESACNAGDPNLIPGLGKSPGEGNDYPLQYSGLENSMDRRVWQTTVCGIAKSRT